MVDSKTWEEMCNQSYSLNVRDDIHLPRYVWDAPTETSWNTGDRRLVCFVVEEAGLISSVLR